MNLDSAPLKPEKNSKCLQLLKAPIAWLAIGYVVCLSPFACQYLKFHPDERHYIDAGLRMVQNGDYLTPRTPEGKLRLKKPIISYWLVAGSYRLFGVSVFSSRIPFLLVGCGVIVITYRLAKYMFDSQLIGILAAAMASIQPSILISSPRSLPDIVLTFCLLISAYGFAKLLKSSETTWSAIVLAYGGGGLAIEAKGLPALLFVCYACAACVALQHAQVLSSWKKHVFGWCMTFAVGASWFFLMYAWHEQALLDEFLGDQITERVNRDFLGVVYDLPFVAATAALGFLPWAGAMIESLLKHGKSVFSSLNPVVVFFVGWILIYFGLLAGVDRVNFRYQTPIAPLMAILAAALLAKIGPGRLKVHINRMSFLFSVVVLLVSVLSLALAVSKGSQVVLGAAVAVLSCCWGICFLRQNPKKMKIDDQISLSVLTLLLIFPSVYVGAQALADVSAEQKVVNKMIATEAVGKSIAFFGKPSLPSKLRIMSGGQVDGTQIYPKRDGFDFTTWPDWEYDILVANDEYLRRVDLAGFELDRISTNSFEDLDASEVFRCFFNGQLDEYLDERRTYLNVAVRRDSEGSVKR